MGTAIMLGAAIGDDAAHRVVGGRGTLCDIVLAAWSMDVDPVTAVLEYAEAAGGSAATGTFDPRCA
ncbi:hypothetical protein [Nocardia arthritidis]|uniref:Uncharacterized protein n=1 Tax=Nocardia arthritidis TaxID=228602 RepID=A0A6G9YU05_9NOCA|nr:hypothetical protein [Nocardia arthritidis]QIS16607.1 hypothetical protein F5544_44020 [Nocardia arthritidis]